MRKQSILISEDVFRELSPLPGTFDYKYLKPHILSAQDQHIQPVLGSKLYFDLQTKIYDGTLTEDEQTLLDDYVAKVMVYFSIYAAALWLSVKMENAGISQKSTNETTPISLNDADKLADKSLALGEFYKGRLIDFLQFNKETYPLYEVAVNDDIPASTENFRGFFSYDDYEEPNYPAATGGGGGGGEGTTDHRQLTAESRNANDQHIIGSITGLRAELDALLLAIQTEESSRESADELLLQGISTEEANRTAADGAIIDAFTAADANLQQQIFDINENSPLSFLDEKLISSQDLPPIGSLAGETQNDVNLKLTNRIERGITIDGSSVVVVRDYYSAQSNITEATGRGVTLIERSTDNVTFITATPPFNVLGDIYWRITPSAEKSFVKIKGQLV